MFLRAVLLVSLLFIVSCPIHPGAKPDGMSMQPAFRGYTAEGIQGNMLVSLPDPEMNPEAFRLALTGYRVLCAMGRVAHDSVITIIDYSLPSTEARLFVIDLYTNRILFKTLVAHGRNSGELYATRFSNKMHSHQSAIGFYLTGSPYQGGQGYSLMLTGLDTGYNDLARVRNIVVHGARYATSHYVRQYGRLGRSFGCPALPPEMNQSVIDCIKGGSVLFSYYPDRDYIRNSKILGALTGMKPWPASDLQIPIQASNRSISLSSRP